QGKKSKQDGDGTIQDLDLPGLVGLKNLGNTCYMNAALQALSNTPALVEYFKTCEAFIPESRRVEYARQKNHMLVESFLHFIQTMWSGKSAIFSPGYLVSDVKKCNDMFQGSAQQDSQEFLRCILDKLHEELTYPRKYITHSPSTSSIPSHDEKSPKNRHVQLPHVGPLSTVTPIIGPKVQNGTSKDSAKSTSSKKNGIVTTSSVSYSSSRSSISSRSVQSSENSSMTDNAEVTPAKATNPSVISDIFEGTLESRVRCLICRREYIKEDKFFDLSIPIDKKSKIIDDDSPSEKSSKDGGSAFGSFVDSIGGWLSSSNRNIKLQDCLASFCATEELTGEDRYRCTQCDALNDCRKTFKITQLPETLCIHLKRFRYDSYSSKINTYVQFPMEDLDMMPFLKSTDQTELRNAKYDLYAMVRHRGVFGGGHYIGYAKHDQDGSWYEYDDTAPADIAKMEAYILFYKRKALHREEDRSRILTKYMSKPLMQIYDKALMVYISRLWFCINVATTQNVQAMVMPIPRIAWDALVDLYGTDGSPIVPITAFDSEQEMDCSICAIEECELNERRRREDADVSKLDSNMISDGQMWYLIGADWLKEWHAFKAGGTDYRGINHNVWRYLHNIYGGGPEFVRCTLDLYAPDPKTIQANSNGFKNGPMSPKKMTAHQLHQHHTHHSPSRPIFH
ncbi:Ubiquitin carboxyl-terminal hydrolase 33, partial [Podila verticillata]